MKAQVFIDNGAGIHLAILDGECAVYVHRFDNVPKGENSRAELGECIVTLITEGFDADDWDGNDLEEFPTMYDELYDAYDAAAEIEFGC